MITAIIAAAGQGKRMGLKRNKLFVPLFHEPILVQTARVLASVALIDSLVIVAEKNEIDEIHTMLQEAALAKPWKIIAGGSERQYSIANALNSLTDDGLAVIHDGARPLIDPATIVSAIERAKVVKAVVVGVPVKDTIKEVVAGKIQATPDRKRLWAVQTPQVFDTALLKKAYEAAARDGVLGTDDASLVERLGVAVEMVEGKYENIKITTPEDLTVARAFLQQPVLPRVGFGYDVHAFCEGRPLILGGVEIPYSLGLKGHSDADVLLHAIKDALLGAAGLGDIGRHFPDTDPRYKGISSLILLEEVFSLLEQEGYYVHNIDATIIAEAPKMAPHIAAMNQKIATALHIAIKQVNIKATTTEKLGFTGRQEGIAAQAIASIIHV
ncbi:MAG: 2-C-methyl-D-erythritol 4-phosphate cytidylyltransferase [Sporomusaceae bacterium]|nr:2-C-methyl-D-erythritol 4-phosphate cytidylyltransferase [Sporomusaceae bacterium]